MERRGKKGGTFRPTDDGTKVGGPRGRDVRVEDRWSGTVPVRKGPRTHQGGTKDRYFSTQRRDDRNV